MESTTKILIIIKLILKVQKKKFNLIINKMLKNNSYIMKLYDKYLKTGKGTDTYPIDPINPKIGVIQKTLLKNL